MFVIYNIRALLVQLFSDFNLILESQLNFKEGL